MALSKKIFIAPIKRDRRDQWPIVKTQLFFVAHVNISWFIFQRAGSKELARCFILFECFIITSKLLS